MAVLSFVALGCATEQNNKATLTIKSTTQPNSKVTINVLKNLDKINLAESTTDSAGNSSVEIPLDKPTIALIQIGEKYGEVYLAPGYDLLVSENGQDYKIPLTFTGDGADVNNYISWVNSNVERIKWASGKGLYELDVMEFRHRFDSLKATINNFHQAYRDSVAVSPDLVAMLEYKNQTKISAVQQEFKFYRLNDLNNEKWAAHKEGREYLSGHIAKELTKLSDDVPFDSALMVGSYSDYETFINFYWRNHIYLPLSGELVGAERYEERMLPLSVARINKADVPDAVLESLLAFNSNFWLGWYGITAQTDSIYNDFKAEYPKSGYTAALDKTYREFLALAPGNPAPEFEGLTRDGEMVSIKDLRGKVVYIDVWATWCRPCIAEIPSSIKLQEKLAKEQGVQFLNVSVDSRRSDWEGFLDKNKNWKGTHIIIEREKIASLYKAYKFQGIPAYMLLDQAGDIVDVKASRPSDEELETEIRQLLVESKIPSL
ncbi:MAG TPA: TlpA disulfide reductase family protein [Chryseosolibacter sp.]|nr:TlpA disulfide reductase family protein [Chryseosolibacter sp.]